MLQKVIAGALLVVALFFAFRFFQERDRKIYEYVKMQNKELEMRE